MSSARAHHCVWDLVRSLKFIKEKGDDYRPYVYIAVSEKENYRVQIFQYYYTSNPVITSFLNCSLCITTRLLIYLLMGVQVFTPVIKFYATIGGYYNENGIVLREPNFVHYSQTGELAITDTGNGAVYLLTPYLKLIHKIVSPFKSIVNVDLMDSYLKKQVKDQLKNLDISSRMIELGMFITLTLNY